MALLQPNGISGAPWDFDESICQDCGLSRDRCLENTSGHGCTLSCGCPDDEEDEIA